MSAGTAIRVTAASQLTLAEDSWIPGSGYKAGLGGEVGVAALSMSAPLTPRVFRTGVCFWYLQVEARVTKSDCVDGFEHRFLAHISCVTTGKLLKWSVLSFPQL